MIVFSHSRDLHKEKGKIDIAYMLDRYQEILGNIYVN